MHCLLRACKDHQGAEPFTCLPHCRTGSPAGGSTLMTVGAEIGQQSGAERRSNEMSNFKDA